MRSSFLLPSLFDAMIEDAVRPIRRQAAPEFAWRDTADAYELAIVLAGVAPERIGLEAAGRSLTVEIREKEGVDAARRLTFSLPAGIETDAISASAENGILAIRLPKHPSVAPRRIPVSAVSSAPALVEGDPAAKNAEA